MRSRDARPGECECKPRHHHRRESWVSTRTPHHYLFLGAVSERLLVVLRVVGLVEAAQHNGKEGIVVRLDEKSRYVVKLDAPSGSGPDTAGASAGAGAGDGGGGEKVKEKQDKTLAVKAENLQRLWGWEAAAAADGGGDREDGEERVWLPPPMLSARTSFGAVVTTASAVGLPPLGL